MRHQSGVREQKKFESHAKNGYLRFLLTYLIRFIYIHLHIFILFLHNTPKSQNSQKFKFYSFLNLLQTKNLLLFDLSNVIVIKGAKIEVSSVVGNLCCERKVSVHIVYGADDFSVCV